MSESIKTIWRIGYFKLFNEAGHLENKPHVSLQDGEYRKLFWRFYWRVS